VSKHQPTPDHQQNGALKMAELNVNQNREKAQDWMLPPSYHEDEIEVSHA
jgi:hypothetical protein